MGPRSVAPMPLSVRGYQSDSPSLFLFWKSTCSNPPRRRGLKTSLQSTSWKARSENMRPRSDKSECGFSVVICLWDNWSDICGSLQRIWSRTWHIHIRFKTGAYRKLIVSGSVRGGFEKRCRWKDQPTHIQTPPGSRPAGEGTRPKQTGCQRANKGIIGEENSATCWRCSPVFMNRTWAWLPRLRGVRSSGRPRESPGTCRAALWAHVGRFIPISLDPQNTHKQEDSGGQMEGSLSVPGGQGAWGWSQIRFFSYITHTQTEKQKNYTHNSSKKWA